MQELKGPIEQAGVQRSLTQVLPHHYRRKRIGQIVSAQGILRGHIWTIWREEVGRAACTVWAIARIT